ncbi:nuclear transport factor 2 family protein [Ramlibacter sp. AW1]|uniref:Nuclear transport factor 2 family protein n=1 Tax=Ramlibacter aurantiacus TaxID=2801330 RepID=A0A936ZRD7_9BURK|nr:nuclear transport factor 2 family protein [Ramlibacter aurantiacus]MBL0419279.1 nuclear transport factor 2 family protein [Ramlibacter aurantiacus]
MTAPDAPARISSDLLQEVRQLYEDYADTLDEQDIDRWPGYFTADALYQVISRENHDAGLTHATIHCDGLGMVQDRAIATRECMVHEPRFLRHFLHGLRVTAAADGAMRARCNFLVIECTSDDDPRVLLVGQYQDALQRTPEGLKFRERRCVYDNFRIYNSLVFPV